MSHIMTKPTKCHVRPAKTLISLDIRPFWSKSWLCAQWVAKDLRFLHADSEDCDQTRRMPRLIWVFARHTCHFVSFVMRRLILSFWRKKEVFWLQNAINPSHAAIKISINATAAEFICKNVFPPPVPVKKIIKNKIGDIQQIYLYQNVCK